LDDDRYDLIQTPGFGLRTDDTIRQYLLGNMKKENEEPKIVKQVFGKERVKKTKEMGIYKF